MQLEIKEVEVVRLEPGDVVVLTMPKDQYAKTTNHILNELFPNNKTVVLFEGMKISKLTQEESNEIQTSEINGHYKIIPDMHLKYQEKYLIVSYQEYNEIVKSIEAKNG